MIQQVVLNSQELSTIVANYVSQVLPPGANANAKVEFTGTHPKRTGGIVEAYVTRATKDTRLADVGAIVTLTPKET